MSYESGLEDMFNPASWRLDGGAAYCLYLHHVSVCE
jgi:hypothetical protein